MSVDLVFPLTWTDGPTLKIARIFTDQTNVDLTTWHSGMMDRMSRGRGIFEQPT